MLSSSLYAADAGIPPSAFEWLAGSGSTFAMLEMLTIGAMFVMQATVAVFAMFAMSRVRDGTAA